MNHFATRVRAIASSALSARAFTTNTATLCVALGAAFATGCGANGSDAAKRPLNASTSTPNGAANDQLPPGLNAIAAARLDSGNVAFRARQYDQALRFYRAAAGDVPEHPAPWYGIYMVANATKNKALADTATKAIASRQGGSDLLGNGMADNHQGGETPSGLPAEHPKVKGGQTSKVPVPQ